MNARDHKKRSPLHLAARKGQEELIEFLLDRNADSNITDVDGNTPLDLAAMRYARAVKEHERDTKESENPQAVVTNFTRRLLPCTEDAMEPIPEWMEQYQSAFNLLEKSSCPSKKDSAVKVDLESAMIADRVEDDSVKEMIEEMSRFRYVLG